MARGRAAGYGDQREAILQHAATLFARSGYPATSMNQVAEACGLSKATLYHYYRDKYAMLVEIAEGHVTRLHALVDEVMAEPMAPEARLRALVRRIVEEYAGAQHAHRVLTEDVRFLQPGDRERILDRERAVVAGFAQAVGALQPSLQQAALSKPVTMLLFGMINWMFTWMKPEGELDYDTLAPMVADLFLGGLPAVRAPDRRPEPLSANPNLPETTA
ncbi:MAG: TetR family transcriptional regulator [Burkholderiales bacterium RIFCSPHIGHO2_12_FULL_69_20]|nr:MAG: TetR family transcriptional regulator [Burkholderiales bacterium RIFCSPHIGHO2_12_FULL_69_20]